MVFKLTPGRAYTVLYSFAGGHGDGAGPEAGLIADGSGNLYGTTFAGGASGFGTVFKLTFAAFNAKLEIDLDKKPNEDTFVLQSSLALGKASTGKSR